jgi:hypothetical protein
VNAIIANLQEKIFAQPELYFKDLIKVEEYCKKLREEDMIKWAHLGGSELASNLEVAKKALEEDKKDVKRRIERLQEGLEEVKRVDLNGDIQENVQRYEIAVKQLYDFVTGGYRSDMTYTVVGELWLMLLQSREKAKGAEKKDPEGVELRANGDKVRVDIDSLVAQLRGLDDETITDIQADRLLGETAKLLKRKAKQVYPASLCFSLLPVFSRL